MKAKGSPAVAGKRFTRRGGQKAKSTLAGFFLPFYFCLFTFPSAFPKPVGFISPIPEGISQV